MAAFFFLLGSGLYIRGGSGARATAVALFFNLSAMLACGRVEGRYFPELIFFEDFMVLFFWGLLLLALAKFAGRRHLNAAAAGLMIYAGLLLVSPLGNILPSVKLTSGWAAIFFMTEALTAPLVFSAACLAVANLAGGRPIHYDGRLILGAFVIFTLCQMAGAVWAYLGWSYAFSWSDRHLASASLWCLLAALIHAGHAGVSARLRNWLCLAAAVPMFYLCGLHQVRDLMAAIMGIKG